MNHRRGKRLVGTSSESRHPTVAPESQEAAKKAVLRYVSVVAIIYAGIVVALISRNGVLALAIWVASVPLLHLAEYILLMRGGRAG